MKYFLVVLIFFLNGCSYKHDNLYVSSKKTTEQSVANTKKAEIYKNGKPRIFITVTYLDSLENENFIDKNKEQFVVGFHFVNFDEGKIKSELKTKDIKFLIENKAASVKKLKSESPILKIIPASNPWSQYFLVQTERIDKNDINFALKLDTYKMIKLKFKKDY